MNTQKQIVLIVTLFFLFVGACSAYAVIDLPVRAADQIDWHNSQSQERGALLFANNCRTCHGNAGEGGVGLPLNKPEFQDQDPLVLKNNRALLQRTLYCGRAGTLMPAWLDANGGSLNARQIEHIIDFITAPVSDQYKDTKGQPTSFGWEEAEKFADTLNKGTIISIGGDTLGTIAKDHLIGVAELVKLNGNINPNSVIVRGEKVKMPDGSRYQVRTTNETLTKIADTQNVGARLIADANGIKYKFDKKTARVVLVNDEGVEIPGLFPQTKLKLPESAVYVVKTADTVDSIAAAHGLNAADIVKLGDNEKLLGTTDTTKALEPGDKGIVIQLPKVDAYVVKGQTLEDLAKTLSNVTADSLGKANNIPANAQPRIGQVLAMPADAWGSAPPDAKNPGTACVQYAVPNAVFQTLPGVGSATPPPAEVTPPATQSKDVTITSGANDWTVTADGQKSDLNKGVVAVAKGTTVKFVNGVGLHTITINGKKDGENFTGTNTRDIAFKDAGTFKITCDFHPAMLAYVIVQ